jgi:hypothetical protein
MESSLPRVGVCGVRELAWGQTNWQGLHADGPKTARVRMGTRTEARLASHSSENGIFERSVNLGNSDKTEIGLSSDFRRIMLCASCSKVGCISGVKKDLPPVEQMRDTSMNVAGVKLDIGPEDRLASHSNEVRAAKEGEDLDNSVQTKKFVLSSDFRRRI